MSNKKHETDGVPERLRQITVGTLPVEKPYIPILDPYTKLQEVLYIDKTQTDGMGRLAIDGRQPVKPIEIVESPDEDTVVLMGVWVRTSDGDLRQGVVADCRWYNGRFDVVDGEEEIDFMDQEGAWDELDYRRHKVVISAVVDYNDEGGVTVWGDPDFYDAAICMAKMVDEECAYSEAVESAYGPKSKSKKKKKSKRNKSKKSKE